MFTSTWFSSAQSSFIPKFLVDFCDKICRTHIVLVRSKMQEEHNFLTKKIQCFIFHLSQVGSEPTTLCLSRTRSNGLQDQVNTKLKSSLVDCSGRVRVTFAANTAQKIQFSIKDFFSKCDQVCAKLRIWSHLLKKSLMKNLIFCVV